jgi:hypothetical protein
MQPWTHNAAVDSQCSCGSTLQLWTHGKARDAAHGAVTAPPAARPAASGGHNTLLGAATGIQTGLLTPGGGRPLVSRFLRVRKLFANLPGGSCAPQTFGRDHPRHRADALGRAAPRAGPSPPGAFMR